MRALRAQMNPHFIFNCMNTIEAFIVEQREEAATSFLQKFSKLIRTVLENAQYDKISLKSEIEVLEWYIQLEQIRSNLRWNYQIEYAREIAIDTLTIPPLILQPFVENAILHGLYHRKKQGGHLQIHISITQENLLLVQIEDNGIGRVAALAKKQHTYHKKKSLGIQFTTERVRKLNDANKNSYDIRTEDVFPDQTGLTGTRVLIWLPVLRKV